MHDPKLRLLHEAAERVARRAGWRGRGVPRMAGGDPLTALREAYNGAVQRMQAAGEAIDAAFVDANTPQERIDELQRAFDAAEADVKRTKANFERAEERQRARQDHPLLVADPPADDQPADDPPAQRDTPYLIDARDRAAIEQIVAGLARGGRGSIRVTREPLVYPREDQSRSFFADVWAAHKHADRQALDRLHRHTEQMVEVRAISSTAGAGGEFVAPLWMMDEWIALARAGRPFANAVMNRPLPPNANVINFPAVATGTATAAQADLGTVQSTDATTTSLAVPVRTVAGQQDVSRQLLERSEPGIDEVIFADLSADYATRLDAQTLSGNGTAPNALGVLNVSGVNAVTYTDATPTVGELYSKLADAIQRIHTGRFLPPDLIVMHPRRWGWFAAALDANGRPLMPINGNAFNAVGRFDNVASENLVGNLMGLPVIVDASVPINLGAGTNEDRIIVCRSSDLWLFEQPTPTTRVFEEVLSGTLAIRLQLYGYFAFASARYPAGISVIAGTGLITPTF